MIIFPTTKSSKWWKSASFYSCLWTHADFQWQRNWPAKNLSL